MIIFTPLLRRSSWKFFSLTSSSTKSPNVSLSRSSYNRLLGSRIYARIHRLVMILYSVWSSSMFAGGVDTKCRRV